MEHTKGKWKVSQWNDRFIRVGDRCIVEADSTFVKDGRPIEDRPLDKANIEFICKAVNSHDALLDACKTDEFDFREIIDISNKACELCTKKNQCIDCPHAFIQSFAITAAKRAKAAIAAAE